jgi:putative ATP-dependent endonuclease of the OLD family
MDDLSGISVRISNFKCFIQPQGFDAITLFNIIIGRNNSGKSTLLDMLRHLVTGEGINPAQWSNRARPDYFFSLRIDESVLEKVPTSKTNIGRADCMGGLLEWTIPDGDSRPRFKSIQRTDQRSHVSEENLREFAQPILNLYQNPFRKFAYRRLAADRDIKVEADHAGLDLGSDGTNATNILQRYLNQEELDRSLVETTILGELNAIYGPDGSFRRILSRRRERTENDWEICLDEENKGLIPMSHTGSGVKTILLVLINLFIVPRLFKRPLSQFLFAFEELENNLHPAVLRRLFLYLAEKAQNEQCRFFITTHSHVVIDLLSGNETTQIIHIKHDGKSASVATVSTFLDSRSIFQDLGVRASDLLQANAVVWLEGPSDRIYFNRWIKEWSYGAIKENVHYTCVYSAGSLLAHYCFEDPGSLSDEEFIRALKINQHAIVLIDSDRRNESDPLKSRAARIVEEVDQVGGFSWITAGKEVENYIPEAALCALFDKDVAVPQPFDDFFSMVKGPRGGDLDKIKLAQNVSPLITRDMIAGHSDLAARLDGVCEKITSWNGGNPAPTRSMPVDGADRV